MLLAQTGAVDLGYGWLAVKTIFAMAVIIVLAIVTLKYLMPRLMKLRRRSDSKIEVLDFQSLEPRKSIYVVRIEDKKIAVGVTDQSVTKLCEWEKRSDE